MRNKGQGLVVSAVIAAGLLLRPASSVAPEQSGSANAVTAASSPAKPDTGEGPWLASCNYWAPAREITKSSDTPAQLHDTFDIKNGGTDFHVKLDATANEYESGCGGEELTRWGIPQPGRGPIHATAIIATVPDPVHSHFAHIFDRTVAAILQAAGDNGYVSSYYWMPWRNHSGVHGSVESPIDTGPSHDTERERKPGLIILKHVPPEKSEGGPTIPMLQTESFYKVVYLFLVAETPTQGVDGFQLKNAFLYEDQLELALRGRGEFSRGRGTSRVAIIGPNFSGSAASLEAGIETAASKDQRFEAAGATATKRALEELTATKNINFLSFGDYTDYDIRKLFGVYFRASGYALERVALLVEDNTTLGTVTSSYQTPKKETKPYVFRPEQEVLNEVQVIRFPREISLLRNAQVTSDHAASDPPTPAASPFLRLSLKDSGQQDNIPQFSRDNTPVSQEAQLMTIGRQLHRFRAQFIAIVASNVLDQVFLAQFLHRACPDARLVFFGSDLLMVREIDNVPFIGSVTVSPYALMGLGPTLGHPGRAYPDSNSLAMYNAASYTFWHNNLGVSFPAKPLLQSYKSPLAPPDLLQAPLWATAIGSDGYYPLGILSPCASDHPKILAAFRNGKVDSEPCEVTGPTTQQRLGNLDIFPARLWVVLSAAISLLCLFHTAMLFMAAYRSPITRDLALGDNDQAPRRSLYVQVATVALISMAITVALPAISLSIWVHFNPASTIGSGLVLGFGILAGSVTFRKTQGYLGWIKSEEGPLKGQARFLYLYHRLRVNVFPVLSLVAKTMLLALLLLWAYLCFTGSTGFRPDPYLNLVGLSFSYRCINPGSGVSPVVPVLLLLFIWYLWAFYQTWRLRFSDTGRPRLPGRVADGLDNLFFVSDEALSSVDSSRDCFLYENITCLLITRQILKRLWKFRDQGNASTKVEGNAPAEADPRHQDDDRIDIFLILFYGVSLILFSLFARIRGVDHFLWSTGVWLSSPYEVLIAALFFPLIVMGLAGWMRMILIWISLKQGLLERLENQPIRFAFSRLKVMGWMTMLRHGGIQEQWRDMARSLESMRQMLHQSDLTTNADMRELEATNTNLLEQIRLLLAQPEGRRQPGQHDHDFMMRIEVEFAAFSQKLLTMILIPYWKTERIGMVASQEIEELPIKARCSETEAERHILPMELHAGPSLEVPRRILLAEEFLAIRYISLVRAVLSNMRHLMMFVSASFVLAMVAWNSYPFQPRQWVDWLFTGFLFFLGSGVIWVFAQMHRNPILSRITDTKANELGWDFYLRIASYGALPVIAWLTYQFPDIGSVVSKFLQPGVPVIK
jgi:hypothetical protein